MELGNASRRNIYMKTAIDFRRCVFEKEVGEGKVIHRLQGCRKIFEICSFSSDVAGELHFPLDLTFDEIHTKPLRILMDTFA